MSKNTKRWLGIAIATVLIVALGVAGFVMASAPEAEPVCYLHGDVNGDGDVTKDDAIYLLYASFPGLSAEFPMQQDGKINEDDVVNKDDAIYLLYAVTPGTQGFPLKGEVHSYYDPTWTWNEAAQTASVTFKCACNKTHPVTATVTRTVEKDATCVAAGSATLSAKATFDGVEYTDTKTQVIPATDSHALNAASCTEARVCSNPGCDYRVEAPGHSWNPLSTQAATCTAAGVERYSCGGCGETREVALEKLDHDLAYVENGDRATGNNCEFVKQYKCAVCTGVFDGTAEADTYFQHTYVTKLTQEVTCKTAGEKTTVCSVCYDLQDKEELPVDSTKHVWNDGAEGTDVITFTCEECATTKTEVRTAKDGSVNTSNLKENIGVNLGDKTSMTMDKDTLDELGDQTIQISVVKKRKDEITLADDADGTKKAQIASDTVYDFTMKDGNNNPITEFSGNVTISLPYTLEQGEDINSIDIWFIDNKGVAHRVNGTYSNGFVTFQTKHFSYYTVTRLTPAERCAKIGSHMEVLQTKAATCTEDGYEMTVCQRCGEVIGETKIHPKKGHGFAVVTQAATCTEDGQVTETCKAEDCGYRVTRKLPALGHSMGPDSGKKATCFAAGEKINVCSRNCGYETKVPLTQLTHNYVESSVKSVAATCSAAGYEIHVCDLCGDEVRKNDTAPLGHAFGADKAQWNWNENMTASVTLVCGNGESHTKVLDAVVTKDSEKSQNASCLGTGAAVYQAVVKYNNQTYTDVKKVTVAAPGHQPDTAWETTEDQHYHLCKVCQEKVDLQGHSWNQGVVTKAPTCVESGLRTVSCTVCGYSNEQTVAATGEHDFQNGVCGSCGMQENTCSHKITRKSQIDTVAVGICSGNVITKFSCDCGENVQYSFENQSCTFGESVDTTEKDAYGNTVQKSVATCTKCGATMEYTYFQRVNTEICYGQYVERFVLSLSGVTVAEREYQYMGAYHPTIVTNQTVDLAEKGICGGTLSYKTCPCGKVTGGSLGLDCELDYVFDKDTMEYYEVCLKCGLNLVTTGRSTEDKETCTYTMENTISMQKDGKEIGNYQTVRVYDNHYYKLQTYSLLGKKCTDGGYVQVRCENCGDTAEEFITDHDRYDVQEIDLSAYDYCLSSLTVESCLCEDRYVNCYENMKNGRYCQMNYVYDKETGEEYTVCLECGIRRYTETTYSEKDAKCYCIQTEKTTYCGTDGAVLAEVTTRTETSHHDTKTEATLAEGSVSCEDGIVIREYCVDCGYEFFNTGEWHYTNVITSHDMTAFGSCQTSLTLEQCPCGSESYIIYTGMPCNWQRISSIENGYVDRCMHCGLEHSVTETVQPDEDPCSVITLVIDRYSKAGVEQVVTFSREQRRETHLQTYRLTLLNGATDCTGGYEIAYVCDRCGKQETLGIGRYHSQYVIGRTRVDNGKMCGEVYQTQMRCACGKYTDTGMEWSGDKQCSYGGGTDNDVLNTWMYPCAACGSFYTIQVNGGPVEGDPCKYQYTQTTHYYDKDNNHLFDYEYSSQQASHDYVATFQMVGETCAEGYYVTQVCSRCQNVYRHENMYTECQNWNLGDEVLHDGTGICGPIMLRKTGCACGKYLEVTLNETCRMEYDHYDYDQGLNVYSCGACGLERTEEETKVTRPGTCLADGKLEAVYTKNGEVILNVNEKFTENAHLWIYSYTNTPDDCSDGYGYSYRCYRCGAEGGSSSENDYHMQNPVIYYELSQYGMCGGYIAQERCACGDRAGWEFVDQRCQWETVSNGEQTVYYCEDCNTYCYRTSQETVDAPNCMATTLETLRFVRDEQTVYTVTVTEITMHHDDRRVSTELVNPEGSCMDGIRYTFACQNCDYGYSSVSYYHDLHEVDVVETSCGSKIIQNACLCGERMTISRDDECNSTGEYDSTGNDFGGTNTATEICKDCGMRYTSEQSWERDTDSCTATYTGTVTVEYGTVTKVFKIQEDMDKHIWGGPVYFLKEGATSCMDGLDYVQTCKYCTAKAVGGHSGSHMFNVVETMDLAEQGAVCGASLQKLKCPCGALEKYDLATDNKCKLQKQKVDMWIEGAIIEQWQKSIDGDHWFDSTGYTFTCAVTEPACGLKLRMAEYWLVEQCVATEYMVWEYWDSADSTWKQLVSLETGDVVPFHAYEYTTDSANGVSTELYTCQCGSSLQRDEQKNADGTYQITYTEVNTTAAGKYKQATRVITYGLMCNSRALITNERYTYVYHDNTQYWIEEVYDYHLDNDCGYTFTRTDSNGNVHTATYEHTESIYHESHVEESTCTQYSDYTYRYACIACGFTTSSGTGQYSPLNHNWSEAVDGVSTCTRCGLENTQGASEGIVLEDMTQSHGNGTSYVIGYWNKENVNFVPSVAVVIEDAEPAYLQNVAISYMTHEKDGITAVRFDMASAHAQAELIANGAEYALRVNFVTTEGDKLEYAITLDPVQQ